MIVGCGLMIIVCWIDKLADILKVYYAYYDDQVDAVVDEGVGTLMRQFVSVNVQYILC